MRNFKKISALFLVAAMTMTMFAGCGKKEGGSETKAPETTKGEAAAPEKPADKNKIVTLKWYTIGGTTPSYKDEWTKQVNDYIGPKIGVNIDYEVIGWGDWNTRRNVIISGGDKFDIIFGDLNTYPSDINMGALLDITKLIPKYAPKLEKFIPKILWDGVTVKGKIYGIPTYKDSSVTQFFIWNKALLEKTGMMEQAKKARTLEAIDPILRKMKEQGTQYPFMLNKGGVYQLFGQYDELGIGIKGIGVRYDDQSHKLVNAYDTPEIKADLEQLHKWYKDGIINPSAPTTDYREKTRPFLIEQGWPEAAESVWGPQMQAPCVAYPWYGPLYSADSIRGSINSISANCKHPDKALEFLQMLNLDPQLRDMFWHGVLGKNYKYVTVDGQKRIELLKTKEPIGFAAYAQATFFTGTRTTDDKFDQWASVRKQNEKAVRSVMMGFNADVSGLGNEIAACKGVLSKYETALLTGQEDPSVILPKMNAELKAVGLDKILTTVQKQIDEWVKTK